MSTPKARQDWIVGLLAKDPNSTYTDVYVKYHDLWGRKRIPETCRYSNC